ELVTLRGETLRTIGTLRPYRVLVATGGERMLTAEICATAARVGAVRARAATARARPRPAERASPSQGRTGKASSWKDLRAPTRARACARAHACVRRRVRVTTRQERPGPRALSDTYCY